MNEKRKKGSVSSDDSQMKRPDEAYRVGVTQTDGIFKDQHEVAKYVG